MRVTTQLLVLCAAALLLIGSSQVLLWQRSYGEIPKGSAPQPLRNAAKESTKPPVALEGVESVESVESVERVERVEEEQKNSWEALGDRPKELRGMNAANEEGNKVDDELESFRRDLGLSNFVYVPRAYETSETFPTKKKGRGLSYAVCEVLTDFSVGPWEEVLGKRGWTDLTAVFSVLLKSIPARGSGSLPNALASWCEFVLPPSTTYAGCLNQLFHHTNGPLRSLALVSCKFPWTIRNLIVQLETEGYTFPERIAMFGSSMPRIFGDKAGLFVLLLPSLPPRKQEIAYRYAPRSYFVSIACRDGAYPSDQWNIWIEDQLRKDQVYYVQEETPGEHSLVISANSDAWRRPQPAIDLGKNIWVSKPAVPLSFDFENSVNQQRGANRFAGAMHFGLKIEVIFSPTDVKELMWAEEKEGCQSPYRVLQKYVEQPVLWMNHKADFRVFVASFQGNPPVHYLYTGQLPVRVSRKDYSEESDNDNSVFVTNLSLSHREGGGDVMEPWEHYLAYLETLYPELSEEEGALEELLFERLLEMTGAILAPVDSFTHNYPMAVHLSAWDVIFDQSLHPWLMEVNVIFNMEMTSAISEFKVPLLAQTLDILFSGVTQGPHPPDRIQDFRRIHVDYT